MATPTPIIVELGNPLGPRVTYPTNAHERDVDAAVAKIAPGWDVDWNESPLRLRGERLASGLRRSPGRQTRVLGETASNRITIRATDAERAAWLRAAGRRPLGEWIRGLCNAAAPEQE